MRKLAGRPVSQGGRDHSSHRLVFMGLSEQRAVLMLYGLSLIMGGLALFMLFVHVQLFYALVVFGVALLLVFGIHLGRANVYEASSSNGVPATSDEGLVDRGFRALHALFGRNWKASFGVVADLALVGAAFVFAHYLRFENGLTDAHADQLARALPFVVAAKVVVFYAMGLYRGIWRHAGTPELIRVGGTTLVASLLVGIGLAASFGIQSISEAVLFIDWMVVTLAVGGIRFGFRGLRQYFAAHRHEGARALLYGAGDGGLLALRELRQNPDAPWTPVGFVDDDPMKNGQVMQGLRVLGAGDDLDALCTGHDVDAVLITTTQMSSDKMDRICRRCTEAGVECRTFRIQFDPVRRRPARHAAFEQVGERSSV
jgi:UDP-GlcNAc:undecaprenyl-phosphate GlcNAc-1-phosphate transferase